MDNYDQINSIRNNSIEKDPYTAFVKGNSFDNLYNQYKNYKPYNINPKSEQEYLLLLVQIYRFVTHDLSLYLDVHPDNDKIAQLRDKYNNLYKQSFSEYELKYGALNMNSNVLGTVPWNWVVNKFPWEVDK